MLELPDQNFDWEESIYRKISELLLDNAPFLRRKHVVTISYYDANLFYNTITSRSITGIIHFLNKTPID